MDLPSHRRSTAARLAPRQSRSERTRRKILDAAGAILSRGPIDAVPVVEIARRAGVSVGGFYARFPGKDDLLHAFDEDLHARARATLAATMDAARFEGRGVAAVVGAYLGMTASFFEENRAVLRQVVSRIRDGGDPEFVRRVREFNLAAHGRLHDLLLARRAEIGHEDPEAAIDLATLSASAALREAILFADRKLNRSGVVDGARLVRELTRAYCAYLGATPPDGTPRRRAGRKSGRS